MLLLIDNLDSFTYNIASAFERLGEKVVVVRPGESLAHYTPKALIIGPGPGHPQDKAMPTCSPDTPILGICLGHQMIAEHFGGKVESARTVMHGKRSAIFHNNEGLFEGVEQGFLGMRYHSLAVKHVPDCLEVTAWTECGEVMGLRHRSKKIESVQFHPDSVGTPAGLQLFKNYILKSVPR